MANSPIFNEHPELAQVMLKYMVRAFKGPVDDTSVWNSLAAFDSYNNMRATYAYPGQVAAIVNKEDDEETSERDATLVVIKADGTRQVLGQDTTFDSMDAAKQWLITNAGYNAQPGTVCTIKRTAEDGSDIWGLYCVNATTDDFVKVSFDQEDIPVLDWNDLVNNPFKEDTEGNLTYTDKQGVEHGIAYKDELNKIPVLDAEPADVSEGLMYYQKIN